MSHRTVPGVVVVTFALLSASSWTNAAPLVSETFDTDVASFPAGDPSYSGWAFATDHGSTAAVVGNRLVVTGGALSSGYSIASWSLASLTDVTITATLNAPSSVNLQAGIFLGELSWSHYTGLTLTQLHDPDNPSEDHTALTNYLVAPQADTDYQMTMTLAKLGGGDWQFDASLVGLATGPYVISTTLSDAVVTDGAGALTRAGVVMHGIGSSATWDNVVITNNLAIPSPLALPMGMALLGIVAVRRRLSRTTGT